METLADDLRYSLRLLRKTPGFTLIAVIALALGIGADTAMFTVVNGVLLRPLPYRDPARLVMLAETAPDFSRMSVSYPNFLDWQRENQSFTGLAVFTHEDFTFTGSGQPEHLAGEFVSADFLPVLGVNPALGRSFLPEEDRRGAGGAVVLTYGLWKRRFGGDPQVLGRSIALTGRQYTVVGILPSDFRFHEQADLYVPIEQWQSIELRDRQNHPGLRAVARLKPGVSIAAAQAEMNAISHRLALDYPKTNAGHGIAVSGMKQDVIGHVGPTLLLLLGAVSFVLVIACANVANLLLARSAARRTEFAIRTALGARRSRMVRQLLTESVVLAVGAGALGVLLAYWGTRAVLAFAPVTLPRSQDIGLDPLVLLFSLAISITTGVLFGLAPAFQSSRVNPQQSLREGTRGSGGGRHRTERAFVALEIGLAVVLLAGAGLMIQSIWKLWRVNPGFDTARLLTARIALSPKVMGNPSGVRLAFHQILDRVQSIPGVLSAATTSLVPLSDDDSEIMFWLGAGGQPPQDQTRSTLMYLTSPEYLRTMRIPLLAGRFITERDTTASQAIVVIDDVLAKQVFPNEDPIGKRINLIVIGPVRVVGVVGHVKHWGLDSDDTAKIRSEIYFPLLQIPDQFMAEAQSGITLVVRAAAEPMTLLPQARTAVAGATNDQPLFGVETVQQMIGASLAERRFTMVLLTIFAATALLLAAIGIYGVISYSVTRRTHEMGIRIALGASRSDVLQLVVREGMILAIIGTACGLVATLALTRLLASLLYGVRPADPVTLFVVCISLGIVAFLATYIPGRRATEVDPIVALRYE